MQRYVFHILLACALGLCDDHTKPPADCESPSCVCKPTMKLEYNLEPKPHLCNNATVDWILQTTMGKVSELNEKTDSQSRQIEELTDALNTKNNFINKLEQERSGEREEMERMLRVDEEVKHHNVRIIQENQQLKDKVLAEEGKHDERQRLEFEISEAHNYNTRLQQENEQLKVKVSSTEAEREEQISRTEQVKADLAHVNEKTVQDNKRLNDEVTQLRQELEKMQAHPAKVDVQPKDCADVQRYGFYYSGIYTIYPAGNTQGMEAFCDLNTDGGGWLVFQRRQDGSESFAKQWNSYKEGFGRLAKEFWLGNENVYSIVQQRTYELRVDITDYQGKRYFALYDLFSIDGEADKYKLHVGKYDGNAGDAMAHHNGYPFSTTDSDNDESRSGNCAALFGRGGWWYVRCYDSNLNGVYMNKHAYDAVVWYQLRENHEPLRHVEMKIRPVGFGKEKY